MSSATGPHPHPPPTDRRREWERAKERKDQLIIQPDGQIRSPSTSLLIEAKRIRVGGFQPEQLAGEYVALMRDSADGRRARPGNVR